MQLVINSYGSYLHKEGERFVVKSEGKSAEVAADKVETILITTSASLSTDAVALALERNADIDFLDKFGDPMGWVWR